MSDEEFSGDGSNPALGQPEGIVLWKEDKHWIVKYEEADVTTQGETRLEAIVMLADAIAARHDLGDEVEEYLGSVFEETSLDFS